MASLPQPPQSFLLRKSKILEQLAIPDAEYTDASPKGSVDAGIRDLIDEINSLEGFVTTSSCAGRVSVFVEGRKSVATAAAAGAAAAATHQEENGGGGGDGRFENVRQVTVAGVGGKGGGGSWLFVSHDPVDGAQAAGDLRELLGLVGHGTADVKGIDIDLEASRLIHFKFEPMILHVLTASPEHAQQLLRSGLQAGFRESGAINLTSAGGDPVTPIVAIRSMGLSLESLIGVQKGIDIQCTVSAEYLQTLLDICNERFAENTKRIQRFRSAVLEMGQTLTKVKKDGTEWEDAVTRRERKRAEGLRKKAELQAMQVQRRTPETDPNTELEFSMNTDMT
ncbi:methyltransferase TYW3-domain-containing protein [Xylariales sp. PMI_506]|nr:methyltransferase TYW3-domain-containing protein [Xylariales sp. PMI_506]